MQVVRYPKAPTSQFLTAASGTYTTPSGAVWLRVRMCGGGGGGSASNSGSPQAGATGGYSIFDTSGNSLVASGGIGGTVNGAGAAGGAVVTSLPSNFTLVAALQGGFGNGSTQVSQNAGAAGGANPFGGAGGGGAGGALAGLDAIGRTGGGGGGGGSVGYASGTGGGAGAYIEAIISNPSATYGYAVAAGGAGGTGTYAGGAGGSGVIIVEEFYG